MDENRDSSQSSLAGSQAGYGDPFLNYPDARGIGWVACWYDDGWSPAMFSQGRRIHTRYGEFVAQQLKRAK